MIERRIVIVPAGPVGTGADAELSAQPGPVGVRVDTTAIVLAGGRSRRFGSDKLAADVDGRPMLAHVVDAAAAVAAVVLVAGSSALPDPEPYGGPLFGLLAALERVRTPNVLLLAGDMPWVRPPVLERLLEALDVLDAPGFAPATAILLETDDPWHPFPSAFRTAAAASAAGAAVTAGRRALRACFERLDVAYLAEASWRAVDPDGASLRDVDLPGDLGGT